MQGQEKAILDDNEMEDHDPTPNVIGLSLSFSHHLKENSPLIGKLVIALLYW